MAENPYAAPTATVEDIADARADFELATRGSRLAAVLLNGIITIVPIIAVVTVATLASEGKKLTPVIEVLAVVAGIWVLIVLMMDIIWLYSDGQSVGKKIMGIKIVRSNGDSCPLWRILILRDLIGGLLSYTPYLGRFYGLIDALFIFGSSRRCIHDYIADTIVIKA